MAGRFPMNETPRSETKDMMQRALADMHGGAPPFLWIEEDGSSLLGCYGPLSYSPSFAEQFFAMAKALYKPGTVKPRNRELAILGLASVVDLPYITYCHRKVGSKCGLTEEQFHEALAGVAPPGLSEEESMAYRLGRLLTELKGPLDDATWTEAVEKLGKQELVGIVHTVAGYRWVALLDQVNGEDRRWAGV